MDRPSVVVLSWLTALAACGGSTQRSEVDGGGETGMRYPVTDGDGFGDPTKGVDAAAAPAAYVMKAGDCDDHDSAVHPAAAEVCDTVDNNCDGKIDDADPLLDATTQAMFFREADGDGFGDPAATKCASSAPAGYVAKGTDCNDTDGNVNPSAIEVCDHVDNNCNGMVDLADPALDLATAHTYYLDSDHDTYGAAALTQVACDGTRSRGGLRSGDQGRSLATT